MDQPAARRLRAATSADLEFALGLAEQTFSGLGDYRAILQERCACGATVTWIASDGTRPAGMAMVARGQGLGFLAPATAELLAIAVCAPRRGTGFGRTLLAAAEATARSWGAVELRVHTAENNIDARAFFAAAGYTPVRDPEPARYPNGAPALQLCRVLDAPRDVRDGSQALGEMRRSSSR